METFSSRFATYIHDDGAMCEIAADNIAAEFSRRAREHAERPAVLLCDRSVTFAELNQHALHVARLLDEASRDRDAPVVCQVAHGLRSLTALLAVWMTGRTVIPLPAAPTTHELRTLIEHSTARLILTDSGNVESLRAVATSQQVVINLESSMKHDARPSSIGVDSIQDPRAAIVIYTSGSTGSPKGVVHSHESLLFNNHVHRETLNLSSADRALLLAPSNTISGITDSLRMLLHGGSLIPVDLQAVGLAGVSAAIAQQRPTIIHFVPTIFRRMMTHYSESTSFESVRLLHLGGEPVTRYDFELFCRHFPADCRLLNNLGCAEVPTFRQSFLTQHSQWAGTAVPLNRAVSGKDVLVVTAGTTRELPVGEDGEIVVRTRYCASGYWREPTQTQASFQSLSDGRFLYRTSDCGRFLPDGTLESLGRQDRQIKHLGRKIDLVELETNLTQLPEVDETAVIAFDHFGKKQLFAFVVGSSDFDTDTCEAFLRTQAKLPLGLRIVILDKLPTLLGGKIDQQKLQSLALARVTSESSTSSAVAATATEQLVTEIWKDVLSLETVHAKTDFFEQGGDSLAMFECLARVEQALGRSVGKMLLVRHSRLADFAATIAQQSRLAQSPCIEQIRETAHPDRVLLVGMSVARAALPLLSEEYSISVLHVDGYETVSFRELTIDEVVDEALQELDVSGMPPPKVIVGFSYGGLVAYALAQRLHREGSARPTALLIEPSAPLPGGRLGIIKESVREFLRRLLPVKQHRLRTRSLRAKEQSGEKLTSDERWELVRPIIRRNRRAYAPTPATCNGILVGRDAYLRSARMWRQLAPQLLHVVPLRGTDEHLEGLQADAAKVWVALLHTTLTDNCQRAH